MKMRNLRGDDLFVLLPMIAKLDIKEELTALFDGSYASGATSKKQSEKEVQAIGIKAMTAIIQKALLNVHAIKGDLNAWLASLTGKKEDTIKNMPLVEYTGLVAEAIRNKEIREAFTRAVSFMTGRQSSG
jgi:hypothetical protein